MVEVGLGGFEGVVAGAAEGAAGAVLAGWEFLVSIPSERGDDLCGQSLGEGGSVVTFVVDRALE
ncbi:hypothetical protein ABT072_41665, partial [Streptomyces sp. NPDC002589]|uniref:hypothetical protein n=1 Tax=Streptomyces sp. NPDC002589 TaxID=3154420 RepID=UPI00331C7ECB